VNNARAIGAVRRRGWCLHAGTSFAYHCARTGITHLHVFRPQDVPAVDWAALPLAARAAIVRHTGAPAACIEPAAIATLRGEPREEKR